MDTLTILRDQDFHRQAEGAVRAYCQQVHEITFIEHGADNLIVIANREYVFRFPRTEAASKRLYFETALLQKLAGHLHSVVIPDVVNISHQPLFVVAHYIEGVHLTGSQIQSLTTEEQEAAGVAIATFMAELNQAVSGLEIRRLRAEAGVDSLAEPWDVYFERLFVHQPLPNEGLRPYVDQFYPLWKDYVAHEERVHAIHDDLHPVNILFMGSSLSGILDFGDANTGSIEEEMRWLYLMGDGVLRPAIEAHGRLTGSQPNYDHIRVWAIMHELSTFTNRLALEETEQFPFQRAQANLRTWLPGFHL